MQYGIEKSHPSTLTRKNNSAHFCWIYTRTPPKKVYRFFFQSLSHRIWRTVPEAAVNLYSKSKRSRLITCLNKHVDRFSRLWRHAHACCSPLNLFTLQLVEAYCIWYACLYICSYATSRNRLHKPQVKIFSRSWPRLPLTQIDFCCFFSLLTSQANI